MNATQAWNQQRETLQDVVEELKKTLLDFKAEITATSGAKSLGYNFTVTPNGQPWCEIQGQVNGNTFLHYTCGSQEVKLFSVLEMNATQAWNQQRETLQDVVEELKKTLLDFKAEITATSGMFTKPRVEVEQGSGLGNNCVYVNIASWSHPRDSGATEDRAGPGDKRGAEGWTPGGHRGSVKTQS
ncbi:NKG2D ligand 1 [Myotis brandtii]|uniref:NKG2D ligand 1 n=1 Tax=Myotis brandtii TaxID=109478 RepID=S7NPQ2_MYOBR|nr:NKG2D ligand 1 [Myotis brandtii]